MQRALTPSPQARREHRGQDKATGEAQRVERVFETGQRIRGMGRVVDDMRQGECDEREERGADRRPVGPDRGDEEDDTLGTAE
jgi:hypothetical protein